MKRVFYCRHDDHREQLVVKFSRGSSAHEKEIKIAQKLRNHFGDEADRILIPSYHHVTIQIGDDSPMNHWTAEIQPAVTRYQDDNRWSDAQWTNMHDDLVSKTQRVFGFAHP